MKIVLVLLTSLTFGVYSRIECDWDHEFLCGDKCLGTNKYCTCGEMYFGYEDGLGLSFICCQEPNTSCDVRNGNVTCHGERLWFNEPCHGSCVQTAWGETLLPCDDKKECYVGSWACRGEPSCTE